MKTRIEKILSKVHKTHKILELGPSYNPAVTRKDGWNVYSLDHASGEELRRKYGSDPTVDASRIQEVDFVWTGGPLESAIPEEHMGTFDVVIASHVIEHQPNLVGFFQSVSRMLKPDGLLSLAVPDKRFCFDYFMPLSLTGEILEAFGENRTRHTRTSKYNEIAYRALVDGVVGWMQGPIGKLSLIRGDVTEARRFFDAHSTAAESPYVDAHTWYFTPASFRLIIHELRTLNLIEFGEEEYFDPFGVEFYISLRNGGADPTKSRMELLKQTLLDVREQTDFLVQSKAEKLQYNQQSLTRVEELEHELASLKEENLTRMEQLEHELTFLKEENLKMSVAMDRWNHRPWYSRAIHKLRLNGR